MAGEELVTLLHLHDRPAQGGHGWLGVDHHRHQEVGKTGEVAELDPLGVDQDEPQVAGGGLQEKSGQHRVDAHALARTGGPGDEQVGHSGQIAEHRMAAHVRPQGYRQLALDTVEGGRLDHLLEGDQLGRLVGHLNPDR